MKKVLISALMLGSVGLWADNDLDLKVTNDTLALYGQYKITQNNIFVRGGYLYNDTKYREDFYFAGIKAEGDLLENDYSNLKVSLFIDFAHTKRNTALPIGVGICKYFYNFSLPAFVSLEGEFAPKVLTFDDADRFSRVDASVGIKPIDNAKIFAGYRNITFNHNYNSSFYAGIGFSF